MKSGDNITLKTLFENEIVIPDMQRDYCWGDNAWDKDGKKSFELVSTFLNSIYDLYEDFRKGNHEPIKLGLIYAFKGALNTIQLCDGQQRITTLYLILGYLNRFTKTHHASLLAINTDGINKPRLCYAVRESTLYFISDLVDYYFLNPKVHNYKIDNIRAQNWSFHDYELDPSISSILAALKIIEKWYEFNKINADMFFDFLISSIEFIYYDLEDREKGEETYVTINTTGEPLTATENLKPILIGNLATKEERELYSNQWEEREDWFWENKGDDTTTDANLNQFFIWYWQIGLLQEKTWKKNEELELNPREIFSKNGVTIQISETEFLQESEVDRVAFFKRLDTIHSYFMGLKRFIELIQNEESIISVMRIISENDSYNLNFFTKEMNKEDVITIILPSIAYLQKFPNQTNFVSFFRRLRKNYINSKRKVGCVVDWRHIIQIIDFSKTENEVLTFNTQTHKTKFKKIPNIELGNWFDHDESIKVSLKNRYKTEIEQWEDHPDIKGDLSFIWQALASEEISFEKANFIWSNFCLLQNTLHEKPNNDPIIANNFRLFLVLINSSIIKHVPRCNGITGVKFSRSDKNANYDYLFNDEYQCLLKKKNLKSSFNTFIKNKIKELNVLGFIKDGTSFEASYILKIWLLCKTLIANQNNIILSYYDDNGISLYENPEYNILSKNKNHIFNLGNCICGYAIKSGFGYSSYCYYNRNDWNDTKWLNTPLFPDLFPYPSNNQFPYDFRTVTFKRIDTAINTTNSKMKKIIKELLKK